MLARLQLNLEEKFEGPHILAEKQESKLTWSDQSIPYTRECGVGGKMLRTYLEAEPLKPAGKSKTIDQIFIHCKDNLIKDWNHLILIF